MKTDREMRMNYLFIFSLIIFSIFGMQIVSAGQTPNSTINWTDSTKTTITWSVFYSGVIRPSGATLDGVEIEGFDLQHATNYTATNLEPDSTHEFCIYKDLVNCAIGKTEKDLVDYSLQYIAGYLLFIIAIICIFIGFYTRSPPIALLGAGFSIIGIIDVVFINFWSGFVFMCVFCAGILVAYGSND